MPNALFADILQQDHDLKIRVTGRSMRPFINNGEVVTLRKVSPESLHCGDIIYYTTENAPPVMHRIVSKAILDDKGLSFTTKGDALLQQDVPVSADQILGKAFHVEKNLPLVGPFSVNLDSILCTSLHRVHALLFSIKSNTRNRLKLIYSSLVNSRKHV